MFEVRKPGLYDFILALTTVVILVALSAVSIYGTVESWINSINDPEWTASWLYADYLNRMNSYAYPFVLALVLILCMCIPKRFVPRKYLLQISVVLLALSIITGIAWGFAAGLGFLLVMSAIIQTIVVLMVITRSGGLVFEREGLLVQLGSALLHLGFVVLVLDLVLVRAPQNHLNVFWLATILITVGTVFSFYSRELSSLVRGVARSQEDMATDIEFETGQNPAAALEGKAGPGVVDMPAATERVLEAEE